MRRELSSLMAVLFLSAASTAFGGSVRQLNLDVNSLTARFVPSSASSSGTAAAQSAASLRASPSKPSSAANSVLKPINEYSVPFGLNATGKLLLQSDTDSVGRLDTDFGEAARFANSAFTFSGEIQLVSGNVVGGFLRFTSTADSNSILFDVGSNGALRQYPVGGAFLLRSENSQGYVNSKSVAGVNTSAWTANAPNESSFVAIRLAPTSDSLVDSNVDLDMAMTAVVPLPLSVVAGGALLAAVAGLRKIWA